MQTSFWELTELVNENPLSNCKLFANRIEVSQIISHFGTTEIDYSPKVGISKKQTLYVLETINELKAHQLVLFMHEAIIKNNYSFAQLQTAIDQIRDLLNIQENRFALRFGWFI